MPHHDDNISHQQRFSNDVAVLTQTIPVNPFTLTKLTKVNDPSKVFPQQTCDKLQTVQSLGEKQFQTFFEDRLIFQKVPMTATMKLNKLNLWEDEESVKYVPPDNKILNKIRCAASIRTSQAMIVFEKELFDVPQSLSTDGINMHHGSKADILKKLDAYVEDTVISAPKSALVIDMAHIIHAKSFADIETFGDFALAVYFTLERLGEVYDRWDLVFDQYKSNSLKAAIRTQRGSGSLYKFTEDTPLPKKMQETF